MSFVLAPLYLILPAYITFIQ